ncbi:MAG: hypothetical protein KGY69_17350 [Bacteroidales bacterium]|nr:hypothetical protein [Bacteroidales bacterium]
MKRRNFLINLGSIAGGIGTLPLFSFNRPNPADKTFYSGNMDIHPSSRSDIMNRIGKPIKVQPVLLYELPERQESVSWRQWGGLIKQKDVNKEDERIRNELKKLEAYADFSVKLAPLVHVNSDEKARRASKSDSDVILLYAAGAGRSRINILTESGKDVVMFLRHKTGPSYLWYEIVHPRLLRQESDQYVYPNFDLEDVVVDDYNKVLIRLRALYGLKNMRESTILAVNGVGGWGGNTDHAKKAIKDIWHLNVKTTDMDELQSLVKKKQKDSAVVSKAQKDAADYAAQDTILSVNTPKKYMTNTFILYYAFKDLMEKHDADGITIQGCMGIGQFVDTTACLAFALVNDEGLMAFCESDFIVIPSGILLRHISGKPAFLNDPTLPHDGVTTCAHCHSPRRMNGKDLEPTHIYTHFESDHGAATKVQYRKGQLVTNIIPDFDNSKWVGFTGEIIDHPFYAICRSQYDCTIDGDWEKLLRDMKGFHWMSCYGDYLQEMEYATHKVGIEMENISYKTG